MRVAYSTSADQLQAFSACAARSRNWSTDAVAAVPVAGAAGWSANRVAGCCRKAASSRAGSECLGMVRILIEQSAGQLSTQTSDGRYCQIFLLAGIG